MAGIGKGGRVVTKSDVRIYTSTSVSTSASAVRLSLRCSRHDGLQLPPVPLAFEVVQISDNADGRFEGGVHFRLVQTVVGSPG
jgi:hypothetical protein